MNPILNARLASITFFLIFGLSSFAFFYMDFDYKYTKGIFQNVLGDGDDKKTYDYIYEVDGKTYNSTNNIFAVNTIDRDKMKKEYNRLNNIRDGRDLWIK